MMYCLVSAVVIQAIITDVHCTVQSNFRESTEIIGFTILSGSKQPPFFSFTRSTSFLLSYYFYAYDRAKRGLDPASWDVIAGTGLKYTRDVRLCLERGENIFGVFVLHILSKIDTVGLLNKKTVSYERINRSLATIRTMRTATM